MIWLLACAQPGTITVVDGRTQTPVDGVPLAVTDDHGARCPEPVPVTADGGHAVIPGPCTRRGWSVRVDDAGWWVPARTDAAEGATVTAWRVPVTGGVGLLDGTELEVLQTNTAVDVAALTSADLVPYPIEIPPVLPRLAGDAVLVLDAEGLTLEAVLPGAARTFGTPEVPLSFGPWFYLGARVPAEGAIERVTTSTDRFLTVTGDDRTVRYVPASALAPGRYAVLTASGARAILFDVAD